jgi:hypothetical protein
MRVLSFLSVRCQRVFERETRGLSFQNALGSALTELTKLPPCSFLSFLSVRALARFREKTGI